MTDVIRRPILRRVSAAYVTLDAAAAAPLDLKVALYELLGGHTVTEIQALMHGATGVPADHLGRTTIAFLRYRRVA